MNNQIIQKNVGGVGIFNRVGTIVITLIVLECL